MTAQGFWFVMMVACMGWYSVITLYVAIKGAGDIRTMLEKLERNKHNDAEEIE